MSDDRSIISPDIRVLSEADVDLYRALRLRALQEEPEAFAEAHEESINTLIVEMAKHLKSSNDSFVLGAFCPNLVGLAGFFRRTGIKVQHKGTLWGVYVTPEARGKGTGNALMQAAITHASTLPGLEQLLLSVATTNEPARRLYSSLGFISYGIESQTLKIGDQYIDEELMMLKLSNNHLL